MSENGRNWAAGVSRRRFLKAGAALSVIAAGPGINILVPSRGSAETAKVVIQYDWLMSNGQIGDVVAVDKGYFADEGIEVEMSPGGPNSATLAPVVSGQAQLGQYSGVSQLLLARSAGAPVKVFATGYQQAPFAYFSLPRAPVNKPEDLYGKRIGIQPTARATLDALIAKAKLDVSKLNIATMGFDMTPLPADELDVVTGWITNTQALSVIGPDRITMMESAAGIIDPGNAYFATDAALETNADVLARFIKAVARGWGYTYEHPEEAVEITVKAYPNLDLAIEKETIPLVLSLSFDANTKTNGWGQFKQSDIADQITILDEIGMFKGADTPTAEDSSTLKILELTAADRPKF
ncbi:MAG TPA: ABC transporter substrate-binding protein [Bauldia sp.]|mgnify:CR=1 FL=1|nr:ABC transporter substrate-binding protein [Bauldia sp.]